MKQCLKRTNKMKRKKPNQTKMKTNQQTKTPADQLSSLWLGYSGHVLSSRKLLTTAASGSWTEISHYGKILCTLQTAVQTDYFHASELYDPSH